jgi:hypothetical protein
VCCPLISGTQRLIFEVNLLGRPTRVFLLCVCCVAFQSVPAYPLTLHSIEDIADSGKVLVLDDDSVWGVEREKQDRRTVCRRETAGLLGQEAVTALWKGDFLGR